MKSISTTLMTICLATKILFDSSCAAELTSTPPVRLHMGVPKTVFAKTEVARKAAEKTKRLLLPRDFALDAITHEHSERVWCKRDDNHSYRDLFREREVSPRAIETLQGVSISELTTLLGEPVLVDGPIDADGTVLYEWRTFNGHEDHVAALEVAAGFRVGAPTNVLFLIFSTQEETK